MYIIYIYDLHMYINLYMSILLTEYLCSDAVLDLSKRNLTEVDIKILEKDFTTTHLFKIKWARIKTGF